MPLFLWKERTFPLYGKNTKDNRYIAGEKEETARENIVKKQRNKNTSSQKTLSSFLETVKRLSLVTQSLFFIISGMVTEHHL